MASPVVNTDGRVDDAAIQLGRTEQWVLETVRRRGTVGFVATMTVAVMIASVTLTLAAISLLLGLDEETVPSATLLGMGVPALVAPPTLWVTVRLTARLDTAGRLLRRAALTDPLTGVPNRRGFFEGIDQFTHSGQQLEVAMVDVDEFKQLNDLHGHAAGDLVLKQVADWLLGLAADAGVVARMGGDEFAFVVPAADELRLPNRQSLVMDGVAFSITIGRTDFVVGEDFEAALARADAELYARKASSGQGAD